MFLLANELKASTNQWYMWENTSDDPGVCNVIVKVHLIRGVILWSIVTLECTEWDFFYPCALVGIANFHSYLFKLKRSVCAGSVEVVELGFSPLPWEIKNFIFFPHKKSSHLHSTAKEPGDAHHKVESKTTFMCTMESRVHKNHICIPQKIKYQVSFFFVFCFFCFSYNRAKASHTRHGNYYSTCEKGFHFHGKAVSQMSQRIQAHHWRTNGLWFLKVGVIYKPSTLIKVIVMILDLFWSLDK